MKLKELSPGDKYKGFVAVKKCTVGEAKNKSKYADMTITDGLSDMPTKQWDVTGYPPKTNTVIYIEGMVSQYQGNNQLVVSGWRNAQPGEYEPGQFIPKYPGDMESLWEEYEIIRSLVEDEECGRLLDHYIFRRGEDGRTCDFINAPAAKGIHHAYLGGLFEHSISVANLVIAIAMGPGRKKLNMDLLITGALLHDLGKIEAYKWDGCVIGESDQGKLLGHISLGLMMLTDYIGLRQSFSNEKYIFLSHLIASHHGRLEWGSPVEPKTKEAVILHHADMLSFQGNVIDKGLADAAPGSEWTDKLPGIGREFWIGGR